MSAPETKKVPKKPKPESTNLAGGITYKLKYNEAANRWERISKPKKWYHRWFRVHPGYEIE